MGKKDALSDVFVRTVKQPGKHADGRVLYLLVTVAADGLVGKLWRLDFRHAGKRGTLALGRYPNTVNAALRRLGYSSDEAMAH